MFKFDENEWIHVSPLGEFEHSGAGVVQVIDAECVSAIVADFKTKAAAENFPGLLVDFDHFSMDTDKSSEAAGWIFDLRADDSGLWAKVRWSNKGANAVKGGDYRLVSPVFPKASQCEDLGGGRIRPLSLLTVALTNDPNIKGAKPLTNRATSPESDEDLANNWSDASRQAALMARRAKNAARKAAALEKLKAIDAERRASRFKLKPLTPVVSSKPSDAVARRFIGKPVIPKMRYYHDGAWYNNEGVFVSRSKPARRMANRAPGKETLYKWELGKTKTGNHCPGCQARNGKVKTAAEWKAMGKTACGTQCKCKLVPVK